MGCEKRFRRGFAGGLWMGILMVQALDASPPGPGFTLAFHDEFEGNAVDTLKWGSRGGRAKDSCNLPQNLSVNGGVVRISLKVEKYKYINSQGDADSVKYTGGGFKSRQAFGYGYY